MVEVPVRQSHPGWPWFVCGSWLPAPGDPPETPGGFPHQEAGGPVRGAGRPFFRKTVY